MRYKIDVRENSELLDVVNAVLNNGGIVELHVEPFFRDNVKEYRVVAVEIQRKLKQGQK